MSRHASSFHEVESSPDGRYVRFDERLGTGAYKEVYLAYDTETGKEVAWNTVEMKRLPAAEKRRIRMETSILSRLHHPHIINFYTVWEQDAAEQIIFTTEIMTSGTLKQYTSRLKQVKLKVVKKWCRQVLSALVYLHSHSPPIIHRDLKCDNVFINGSTGEVRIGDFGLSVARHATHVESVLGTPEFMAPELYDEKYSESVDCYAFGMAVLEMTTKEYPYQECSNAAQIWKKVSSGQKPEVLTRIADPQLRAFIDCCLLPADLRPSAAELTQHPFLAWKRSDPFRDGLLVVVDPKAGAAAKAGAAGEEAERAVKEAEREVRRREEDEDDRIRERARAHQQQQQDELQQQQQQQQQARLEFRPSSSRPQPIDTDTQTTLATPPSQLISPFTSPSPSPPLKRDMSVPSRLPSMLPPQPPGLQPPAENSASPPPPAAAASPTSAATAPMHSLPALFTSSSRTASFPPPLSSPQSAPPLDVHPPASGTVSAVMVDVDGRVAHVASVTLHIHFDAKRKAANNGYCSRKQIRFDYSLQDDTSVSLATEMVKALRLPDADRMIMIISTTLEEKIDPYRRDWFDSMREGAGASGGAAEAAARLRTSGLVHPHPAAPPHPNPLPPHGSPPPHADYHPPPHTQPQLVQYPPHVSAPPPGPHQPPPQQAGQPAGRPVSSSAHHRYSPSTQLTQQQAAGSRASGPAQMSAAPYPRPPSLHTGAAHVSGSHSATSRPALTGEMRSRYQTLPQGFVFPQPGGGQPMTQAAIKSVQQHHQQQQQQAQQQQQQQQQQQAAYGGAPRLALGADGARGRVGVSASPIGSGTPPLVSHGHSAAAASSTPPAAPYSRRSSMPLQPAPLAVQLTTSPVVSPPALSPMSAATTSSPPLPLSPSAASAAVPASHPSSHADAWTAYYRSLSVPLLKERVKLMKGAEVLSGAVDKAELIQMLVDSTPSTDWPDGRGSGQSSPHAATSPLPHSPQPGDGKKRSAEDGRASRDSRPSSRHSSHNESNAASAVSSAAALVASASSSFSPPTQPTPPPTSSPFSPLAQSSSESLSAAAPLSVSVSAAAEEWTDLAFDVVTKEAADAPEESKEIPHGRPSSGSGAFRDLDPLFNSPAQSAREAVALHAPPLPLQLDGVVPPPLSSPASASSGSSLYDFSISPSQPASSPFSASASFPGSGQRRPSLSFFSTAPVAGGVDDEPAQHRRMAARNSILDTASIDMLSEMVLGVGPGKGGLTWRGEEKENGGSSAQRGEEEAAGR